MKNKACGSVQLTCCLFSSSWISALLLCKCAATSVTPFLFCGLDETKLVGWLHSVDLTDSTVGREKVDEIAVSTTKIQGAEKGSRMIRSLKRSIERIEMRKTRSHSRSHAGGSECRIMGATGLLNRTWAGQASAVSRRNGHGAENLLDRKGVKLNRIVLSLWRKMSYEVT